LAGNLFQLGFIGCELRQSDMDRRPDGGAEIGWTESQISKTIIARKWKLRLNGLHCLHETSEDLLEISALLHGDDSQMVLFIAPDEEGLLIVMEDSTTSRPVSARVRRLKESISFLEEKMIVNELLLGVLVHTSKGEVCSLQIAIESLQC